MGVPPMSPMGILPMSTTGVPPVGFPSHGRAGTALRLAGKMLVPRCAHAARRIIIVYHPPPTESQAEKGPDPNGTSLSHCSSSGRYWPYL
jgi:hypothetical protein